MNIDSMEFTPKNNKINLKAGDKNILSQLNLLIKGVTKNIEIYRFDKAAEQLYEFIWHEFADKYIEESKQKLKENDTTTLAILLHVYSTSLKLLHPFMPFITEELNSIFNTKSLPLIVSSWPK